MINLSKDEKNIFFNTLRQVLFFILIFSFIFFIHYMADIYKTETFSEHSVVENLQLSFLVLSGLIFVGEAIFFKQYRSLLFLLASLCFFASFRELDSFFDNTLPVVSWKIGYIFPISAIIYVKKHFEDFLRELIDFCSSPAFFMMLTAVVVVLPIAQCIGHGSFVRDVLGNDKVADIKEFFEESCETMGYFIILLSSFETYFGMLKKQK